MKELAAKYSAAQVEDKWYQYWLDHKFFHSEPNEKEPYTIVIPPPNVTGILHMGHVLAKWWLSSREWASPRRTLAGKNS